MALRITMEDSSSILSPLSCSGKRETMLETLDEFEAAVKKFETVEEFIQFADELSRRHREMESLGCSVTSACVAHDSPRMPNMHQRRSTTRENFRPLPVPYKGSPGQGTG